MNLRNSLPAALLLAALLVAGCGHESGGGVAVIDLTAAAEATGQDVEIRLRAEEGQQELINQLQALATSLEADIAAEREKAGESPSDADAARLLQLEQSARAQVTQAQQQAQAAAQQLQTDLVVAFRDSLMPMATRIAAERGYDVILSKDAYIFWANDAADITDAVIAAWTAENPADAPVDAEPAPAAEAPAAE